jgi:small subunit ribosomal protein S1
MIQSNTDTSGATTMKDVLASSDLSLPKVGEVVQGTIISAGSNSILIDLGPIGTGIVYPGQFYDNPTLQKELKPGQTISAIMLDVEDEEQLGYRELSLKQAQQTTAWEDIRERKEKGEIISTKISNINKGGLIVEVNGIQGFLPLSQLSSEHYPKVEGGDTTKIVQILQKYKNEEFKVKI